MFVFRLFSGAFLKTYRQPGAHQRNTKSFTTERLDETLVVTWNDTLHVCAHVPDDEWGLNMPLDSHN